MEMNDGDFTSYVAFRYFIRNGKTYKSSRATRGAKGQLRSLQSFSGWGGGRKFLNMLPF